jgi:hypothetical protein
MDKNNEELEYEKRVKNRVLILKDFIENKKISLTPDIAESLLKVRYDKNWEPDLETIDGVVRSLALATEFFDYRDKTKELISLKEIQEIYFSMIEKNFSSFYILMLEKKMNPHQVAHFIAYESKNNESLNTSLDGFLYALEEFWKSVIEPWYLHLEDDNDSIKAVFWWDLFPSNNENIASKCGIYTDTIILPCPYMRTKELFKRETRERRIYFLIKHGLNILQYKDIALADLEKPILVVLADEEMIDSKKYDRISELAKKDALYHAQKVFWREFDSFEELIDFGSKLDSIEKLMPEIKNPDKVLFDLDFKEPIEQQIQNQTKENSKLIWVDNPWLMVALQWMWRMWATNELLSKASRFGWTPLIDAPTSWEYFKWKLEYDAERIYWEKDYKKMHIMKALIWSNNTDIEWIWKIPPEWLIELRKTWAIHEIRSILGSGINELVSANSLDFNSTSKKVSANLDEAINKHQDNIKKLRNKKWKIAGHDIGSLILMWSVEIVAICNWTPLYWLWAFGAGQLVDLPKIKDLPKTFDKMRDVDKEKEEIKRSPIGIIFKYK